jgi:hypothetical protein
MNENEMSKCSTKYSLMLEMMGTYFDGRNNGFDIPRPEMTTSPSIISEQDVL